MPNDFLSDDLRELYQQIILDHNRNPKNFRIVQNANQIAEGFNPLCGDKITVYIYLKNGVVEDISFLGSGCAISRASASIMTTCIKGKTQLEAEALFKTFQKMATTGEIESQGETRLNILAGVHKYPVRVKCATLAWHTMRNCLVGNEKMASTE